MTVVRRTTSETAVTVELSSEPVRRGQSVGIEVSVVGELRSSRITVALVALPVVLLTFT